MKSLWVFFGCVLARKEEAPPTKWSLLSSQAVRVSLPVSQVYLIGASIKFFILPTKQSRG